jgi:hypothetical protein
MSVVVLESVLGIHAVSTLLMAGLIWMVQLVHYPLFARVGRDAFCDYETSHTRRITWLVGPLMLLEAASAAALFFVLDSAVTQVIAGVGLALLLIIWLSTAFLQVPCHNRLSRGFDDATLRRLVGTNWIRTAVWSVRGVLATVLLRVVDGA